MVGGRGNAQHVPTNSMGGRKKGEIGVCGGKKYSLGSEIFHNLLKDIVSFICNCMKPPVSSFSILPLDGPLGNSPERESICKHHQP